MEPNTAVSPITDAPLTIHAQRTFARIPRSKRVLEDVAALLDMTFVVIIGLLIKFIYVHLYYHNFDSSTIEDEGYINYLLLIFFVIFTLYTVLSRSGYFEYNPFQRLDLTDTILKLALAVLFAFAVAMFVVFLFKESSQFSRVWALSWCLSTFAFLAVSKMFWFERFKALTSRGFFARNVCLVGAGEPLRTTREELLANRAMADLVEVCDLVPASGAGDVDADTVSAKLKQFLSDVQSKPIDEIVIALPNKDIGHLDMIVRYLRLLPVEIKVGLNLGECKRKALEISRIGSTNYVSIQKQPIRDWNVYLKTVEDFVLAGIALIVFLPAMVVIALLIKLDSRGPVLFRQRRHGCNHKIIHVMKFRTMTVLEDGTNIVQATKNDARVTRVGSILRKTSLDELPQLLNVLSGDMSLVGPRPHALAHNDYYSRVLEDYASRHRVKPGITGWAQVNGFRGESADPALMEQRVQYDLEYIENWSIFLDLKILLLTPIYGFYARRAY